MSGWAAFCDEKDRRLVARAARTVDADATVEFASSADSLRRAVLGAAPAELCVMVGPLSGGVAPVNLAAAVAQDGNARCVALAERNVSGSLRSRAARAGVDHVVELTALEREVSVPPVPPGDVPAPSPVAGREAADGGRRPRDLAPPAHLPRLLADDASRGAVVVFCSGRGGVGKTTVAAAAAAQASLWGVRTCALDLDLSCGNLYSCFGLPGGTDLARLATPVHARDGLPGGLCAAVSPALSVAGPCERPEAAELVAPRAGELLVALARANDLVLVDTSPTFTDAVAQAAQLADRLVIVSDGRPGTAVALARTGGLAVRLGVARTRIVRLENRSDPRSRVDLSLGRADVGLEAARAFRVVEGGPEVEELVGTGQALDLAESRSGFRDSVAAFLAQLLAELGRLPDHEDARRAAERSARRRGLLGLRRGAR